MKILLTEDNIETGHFMKNKLESDGYTVEWFEDGVSSENAALNFHYDVIIMDINIPRKNGIQVIKSLRQAKCHTPILILTADNQTEACVNGLISGADDYLTKPFVYDVMRERLNALVRRESKQYSDIIRHGKLILDPKAYTLSFKGKDVRLGRHEYKLLEQLMLNSSRVMSREHLMEAIYGWDNDIASNALEVHIHNLRKLFGKNCIKTVRGIGYQMGVE